MRNNDRNAKIFAITIRLSMKINLELRMSSINRITSKFLL